MITSMNMTRANDILPPSMAQSKVVGAPVQDLWNLDLDDILNDSSGDHYAPVARGRSPPKPTTTSPTKPAVVAARSITDSTKPVPRSRSNSNLMTSSKPSSSSSRSPTTNSRPAPPSMARSRSTSNVFAASTTSALAKVPSRTRSSNTDLKNAAAAALRLRHRSSNTKGSKSPDVSSSRRAARDSTHRRTNSKGSSSTTKSPTRSRSKSPMRHLPNLSVLTRSKSDSKMNARNCKIRFDKVRVREYQQILGDNPCKEGPSLGLGWQYHEKKDTALGEYEKLRKGQNMLAVMTYGLVSSSRKDKAPLLSARDRENMALELGYSLLDIEKNKRQNEKAYAQRKKSMNEALMEEGNGSGKSSGAFDPVAVLKRAQAAHGFKVTNSSDC